MQDSLDLRRPQSAFERARERTSEAREMRVADDADPGHT
jgi:hypothetical protein